MNFTKHTAHYQLCSFIGSQEYYNYDLKPEHLLILFIICRYLDMGKNLCCLKQINLAKECRMSERSLRDFSNQLIEMKLLFRYMKGKLYYYELGEVILIV